MGVLVKLGRCVSTREGVIRFPDGLCSRGGKARDIFFCYYHFEMESNAHFECALEQ